MSAGGLGRCSGAVRRATPTRGAPWARPVGARSRDPTTSRKAERSRDGDSCHSQDHLCLLARSASVARLPPYGRTERSSPTRPATGPSSAALACAIAAGLLLLSACGASRPPRRPQDDPGRPSVQAGVGVATVAAPRLTLTSSSSPDGATRRSGQRDGTAPADTGAGRTATSHTTATPGQRLAGFPASRTFLLRASAACAVALGPPAPARARGRTINAATSKALASTATAIADSLHALPSPPAAIARLITGYRSLATAYTAEATGPPAREPQLRDSVNRELELTAIDALRARLPSCAPPPSKFATLQANR